MVVATEHPVLLENDAIVAIVGGGPAGAFSAIHLITQARAHGRRIRVVVFERNCQPVSADPGKPWGPYAGCPQCAGGISPRLHEAIEALGITLPPEVIQSSISTITVRGNWKSIILPIPRGRKMSSVYRGTLPYGQHPQQECFDAIMLGMAVEFGAQLIGSRVFRATYNDSGSVDLGYLDNGMEAQLTANFVVFAGGVNEKRDKTGAMPTSMDLFQQLQPGYVPPRLRKALIFELQAPAVTGRAVEGELHFIESSSDGLRLEMCSILTKREYITVTLVGKSIDESVTHEQNLRLIKRFLTLPQIQRTLPPHLHPTIRCICNPNLVVGTANRPFGQRIAAAGDMATSRQYKDGILSAHNMAESLARTVFGKGIDYKSLEAGYGPTIASFQRDNRYAAVIFYFYRWFFTSPLLSRVIYQAFASEKKARPEKLRKFKKIFWAISSGDGAYEDIAWAMLRPSTLWLVLWGGVYVTLRNWFGERFFGLDWHGIERVPTAVSRREFKAKRITVLPDQARSSLAGHLPEFECMYTVHIRAAPEDALAQLAKFGEEDRPYLNPRWVNICRTRGEPLCEGSVIKYTIFGGLISFSIEQQPGTDPNLIVYKVSDGFAHDGAFAFEVDPLVSGYCDLTIYLAFDYARGDTFVARVYWRIFKLLFPEFIHDVLWNHALCEIKYRAEEKDPVLWDVS